MPAQRLNAPERVHSLAKDCENSLNTRLCFALCWACVPSWQSLMDLQRRLRQMSKQAPAQTWSCPLRVAVDG